MTYIRTHCGSAHVKGKAKKYPYFIASKFIWSGKRYVNDGLVCGPYRSFEKCCREGREYAKINGFEFLEGYGSLHNQKTVSQLLIKNQPVIIS